MDLKTRTFAVILFASLAAPELAAGSDDAVANRFLVESARLVQSAERAPSTVERLDLYRRAKTFLVRIQTEHPASPAAAKLATGQSVGSLSIARIDEALRLAGPCEDTPRGHLVYDCVLDEAEGTGTKAAALKAAGDYRHEAAFELQKQWRLEAELANAEASAGEFSSALRKLNALEDQLPSEGGSGGSLNRIHLDALGAVACKLASAGYDAESRALFRRGRSLANDTPSPRRTLSSIAKSEACAGHFDAAVETAEEISGVPRGHGLHGEGEPMRIRTLAAIGEAALDDGEVDRAASILDGSPAGAAPIDFDSTDQDLGGVWPEARSAVVGVLARLGLARAREGNRQAANVAFERALDVASAGRRNWAGIGKAAIENRRSIGPTWGPGKRAADAVDDLVTIATAMHGAGLEEKAAQMLAHAVQAAGGEADPLAAIAAASFRVEGQEAGRRALARAEEASTEDLRASAWQTFMDGTAPRCSYDYEWFDSAKTFNLLAEHGDFRFPACGGRVSASRARRVALAAAYLANGDEAGVEEALSCGVPGPTPDPADLDLFMELAKYGLMLGDWNGSGPAVPTVMAPWAVDASIGARRARAWEAKAVAALVEGEPLTAFGAAPTCASESKWVLPATADESRRVRCSESAAGEAIVVFRDGKAGTDSQKTSPRRLRDVVKVRATFPAAFGVARIEPTPWSSSFRPGAVAPGHGDELRARFARQLAREYDFDYAVRFSSEIVDPDERARVLTELASLQVRHGFVRDARATLEQAFAAAREIPDILAGADSPSRFQETKRATIQDRAIRFAEIARVLAELLPHE